MKQFRFMMMTALVAVMSLSAVSCSDDDDDVAKSNHDKKMEAVTAEVQANKKHDTALLLVTFGSTWDAPQTTFNNMKAQFASKFPNMDIYFSFTSGDLYDPLRGKRLELLCTFFLFGSYWSGRI